MLKSIVRVNLRGGVQNRGFQQPFRQILYGIMLHISRPVPWLGARLCPWSNGTGGSSQPSVSLSQPSTWPYSTITQINLWQIIMPRSYLIASISVNQWRFRQMMSAWADLQSHRTWAMHLRLMVFQFYYLRWWSSVKLQIFLLQLFDVKWHSPPLCKLRWYLPRGSRNAIPFSVVKSGWWTLSTTWCCRNFWPSST